MSKERLEEIINNLPYSIRHEGNTEKLIEYAKEQAERVPVLEFYKQDWMLVTKQNKRYRDYFKKIKAMLNDVNMDNSMIVVELNEVLKGLESESNE